MMESQQYDPILASWLSLGRKWLDAVMNQGIAHITSYTQGDIKAWAQHAETMGFGELSQLAMLLLGEQEPRIKSEAFYTLLLQQDLYQQLYNAEQLAFSYPVSES